VVAGAAAGSIATGHAAAGTTPVVSTDRGCYLVGQRVHLRGSGFAPNRTYDVAIDGVDFGQATTDAGGSFSTFLLPGGLGGGVPQSVDRLDATDGTRSAATTFTLTRSAGARFLAASGNVHTLRTPFEAWGFALGGRPRALYLHYVTPSGRIRQTSRLGRAGGQCGYLRTRPRRLFPFSPSPGTWTLQVDTQPAFLRDPGGPVARIRVTVM
jgi:hypothetical protein